jgi:hypothetical protein
MRARRGHAWTGSKPQRAARRDGGIREKRSTAMFYLKRYAVAWGIVAVAALGGGCSSSSGGQKTFEGFTKTRSTLAAAQTDIDQTLASLNGVRITTPDNLNNAFSQYKKSVDQLEQRGKDAKQLAASMQENMTMNIKAWQKEMETIKDPEIKASVEDRRAAVATNYELLKMYASEARHAYEPFLQDNRDIVKALSIDLSPAARSSLGKAMDKTATDGKTLKQKIAAMQKAMDNIAQGQSPVENTTASK